MPVQQGNSPVLMSTVKNTKPYFFSIKYREALVRNIKPKPFLEKTNSEIIRLGFYKVLAESQSIAVFKSFKALSLSTVIYFSNSKNYKSFSFALSYIFGLHKSGLVPRLGIRYFMSSSKNFKYKTFSITYKTQGTNLNQIPTRGQLYPRGLKL